MTNSSQTPPHRRHTTVIALIVAAVLVLAGGGLALALATRPTPAATATASATPTAATAPTAPHSPTPSATPTPTAAPASEIDLAAPQTWVIGANTVGPLRRGQSMEDAAAALSTAYVVGDAGCRVALYESKTSRGAVVLTPDDSGRNVRSILFTSSLDPAAPSPRTAEGIGFGSTAAEIVAAYPGIQRPQPNRYPTYSLQQADGSWIDFRVAQDTQRVIEIHVTNEDYPPSEFCG